MTDELDINKPPFKVFVDILPIEPLPFVPAGDVLGQDDEGCHVTVYWRTPLDGFMTIGWPAPQWLVGDYDELCLGVGESVRMWL